MDLHMWLAFCVAAGMVLVIPGPAIIAGVLTAALRRAA
jgi:threonine/homoserine/homoserine lactone efflux protein